MSNLQDLTNINLVSILPDSISNDPDVMSAAMATQEQLQGLVDDIKSHLPLMPNLDKLPGRIVDLLAWQYHVVFYDQAAPIENRRDRVRRAIEDHRLAGTAAGMKRAIQAVFRTEDFDIVEWWQMDPRGDPYTFYVLIHVSFSQEQLAKARAMRDVYGNVRSKWIGWITWDQFVGLPYANWNALQATELTWDQLQYYYIYGPA